MIQKPKRRRLTFKARIPNEEIRWWVLSSAAAMREKGGYSEGYQSVGLPDTCPYTDADLGFFTKRGSGMVERARECGHTWHAIGSEHREVLAAFYGTREPAPSHEFKSEAVDDAIYKTRAEAVIASMCAPSAVVRAKGMKLEILGVAMLLHARGVPAPNLATSCTEAIRVAHEIWDIEREQIDHSSMVRWKTGVL